MMDQIPLLASTLQPGVLAGIPLRQFPEARPPLPPGRHRLPPARAGAPPPRFAHQLPQRLPPNADPMAPRQMLAGQRGPEASVGGLPEKVEDLLSRRLAHAALGRLAPQAMDDGFVALLFPLLQQPPHLAIGDPQFLCGLLFPDQLLLRFAQRHQTIPFGLCHQ